MSKETSKLIETFRDFKNKNDLVKKTIMNIFICKYDSPFWAESISIFKYLNLPTLVQISGAVHVGLGYQILLDTSLEDSKILADNIIKKFPETPLIVISEVMVEMKSAPIGEWQDDDLVETGRYFDRLVREGVRGLFIF
jgi:hypothetical protein